MDQETYDTQKDSLISKLFRNTRFSALDFQVDYDQIAVQCETYGKQWSICFQNGDMNGKYKGEGIWTNEGANDGISELIEILEEHEDFEGLIDPESAHETIWIEELVFDFISAYSERKEIDRFFDCDE